MRLKINRFFFCDLVLWHLPNWESCRCIYKVKIWRGLSINNQVTAERLMVVLFSATELILPLNPSLIPAILTEPGGGGELDKKDPLVNF